jgi:hypothetical protein
VLGGVSSMTEKMSIRIGKSIGGICAIKGKKIAK